MDTGYALASFPLAILAFVVVVTGICLGTGLLVIWVGLAVLALTLVAARGLATAERAWLPAVLRRELPRPVYRRAEGTLLRRLFTPLRDPQCWLDALHAVIRFPFAVLSFVVTADLDSASPVARSVLVADVTGDGEVVALASDGRQVLLYALDSCELVPVQNPQGEQYAFDLGFTGYGTGVGCTDLDGDGVRDLVGLLASANGTGYSATAVVLDGPRARTSDVSVQVSDADAAEVAAARSVTCGDLDLARDGVTTGP